MSDGRSAQEESAAERLRICADGALTVKQAVDFTGISRSVLYEHMGTGEIRVVRVGRRTLLPRSELVRLLAQHLD